MKTMLSDTTTSMTITNDNNPQPTKLRRSSRGVMVKALDFGIAVSEFEPSRAITFTFG